MRLISHPVRLLSLVLILIVLAYSPLSASAQSRTLYMPMLQSADFAESRLTLVNSALEPATVTLTARGYDGKLLKGSGIINPVSLVLAASHSKALRAKEIFGSGVSSGWVELQSDSPSVSGAFFLSDSKLTSLESAELATTPAARLVFPNVTTKAFSANNLVLVNTSDRPITRVTISFYENSGRLVTQRSFAMAALAGLTGNPSQLASNLQNFEGYAVAEATGVVRDTLIGFETYRDKLDIAALAALPDAARSQFSYITPFGNQTGFVSTLVLVNYGSGAQTVRATAAIFDPKARDGNASFKTVERTLASNERWEARLDQVFGFSIDKSIAGYVRYQTLGSSSGVFGYLEWKTSDGMVMTAMPADKTDYSDLSFSYFANGPGFFTGLTLMNAGSQTSSITIDALDPQGYAIDTATLSLAPNSRWSGLMTELLPATEDQIGGRVHISASSLILAIQVLGLNSSGALAVVPGQGSVLVAQENGQVVSATSGGTVVSDDSSTSLSIPPGALRQNTPIRITPLNVAGSPKVSPGERLISIVEALPAGTQFRVPARLRFPLAERVQPGSTLPVLIFNPATSQYEPSEFVATVDPSGRKASAEVTHFTRFAVASAVSSVQISNLNPSSGAAGSIVTISGSGFALTPSDNTVLFTKAGGGTLTADVFSATSTSLTTAVPIGAASGKVYVRVGSVKSNGVRFKVIALTNLAPSVDAGTDQSITLPGGVVLSGTVSDDGLPMGNPVTTAWSMLSGPGTVTFGDPSAVATPAAFSAAGTYMLRLTASDTALTASNDIVITVNSSAPTNQAPVVNAGPDQIITLPSAANVLGTATDDGLPDGALTAAWIVLSGPGTVTFDNATAFTTSVTFSTPGTYALRLTASDTALSSTDDVVIVVNSARVNQAPVVNAGPDQTITLPGSATLSGTATDDGLPSGILTKNWTKATGPGTVTFANAAALSTTATFSAAGTYMLQLTASDGALSASSTVTIVVSAVASSGNPPVVDAGPAKVIALPAKDLTFFGHATDPDNDPLIIQWTQTSGPVPATFSAPWALVTTVTFTTPGAYTFQLSVSDSVYTVTQNTTVTVLSAAGQTAFYVDPTYTGSTSDGSAARPWKTLSASAISSQWTAINNALASNNVIVYFSVRQAGSDTPEVEHNSINIWRTDTSANRLTLDGMSKYNANDAAPSWLDYTGTNKFNINITSGSISIGVQSDQTAYPANYTTIRGFNTSGNSGRLVGAGNYYVVEYNDVHDITGTGATIMFQHAVESYPICTRAFGNLHDITFRGNTVTRGLGEALYIAGNYQRTSEGGCPSWGNTHSDILIESNDIDQASSNGEQGDGIDLKSGLLNVTVRNNTIKNMPTGVAAWGLVSTGTFDSGSVNSHYLFELNTFLNANGIVATDNNGTVIRNNVIWNGMIYFAGAVNQGNKNVVIVNNTIYGRGESGAGIGLGAVTGAYVRNNLIAGLTSSFQQLGQFSSAGIDSDYNALVTGAQINSWSLGAHDRSFASGTNLFVGPSTGDLRLTLGSPAIDVGLELMSTGFSNDRFGVSRPQGSTWDIGASEFKP